METWKLGEWLVILVLALSYLGLLLANLLAARACHRRSFRPCVRRICLCLFTIDGLLLLLLAAYVISGLTDQGAWQTMMRTLAAISAVLGLLLLLAFLILVRAYCVARTRCSPCPSPGEAPRPS